MSLIRTCLKGTLAKETRLMPPFSVARKVAGVALAACLTNPFLCNQSFAEVRETASMEEALTTADKDSLVIFDIDNTILKPTQMLGSDQWFEHLVEDRQQSGLSKDEAIRQSIADWTEVQKVTDVVPVESITPGLIRSLQRDGISSMALTARPVDLSSATHRQLNSLGIDFKRNPPLKKNTTFRGDNLARYDAGVLFVGPKNNKGRILATFIDALLISGKTLPSKIIFVDDKSKHVHSVEDALKKLDLNYIGFRYSAADWDVSNFDRQIAKVQWHFFKSILDDTSAKSLIEFAR